MHSAVELLFLWVPKAAQPLQIIEHPYVVHFDKDNMYEKYIKSSYITRISDKYNEEDN